jgi:hypothetical protein
MTRRVPLLKHDADLAPELIEIGSPRRAGSSRSRRRWGFPALYGLDIWFPRKKVLNVEWNDEGLIQIGSYRPGAWEGQLSSFASGDG